LFLVSASQTVKHKHGVDKFGGSRCRFHVSCQWSQISEVSTDNVKGKGKAVPLQAWSGPEGSGKLRFSDFMTIAQDGGKVVILMHQPPLPLGNTPGTHFF
jgi:hypothetical protein